MNTNILSIFAIAIDSTGLDGVVVGETVQVYIDAPDGRGLLEVFNMNDIQNGKALEFLNKARAQKEQIAAHKECPAERDPR